MSRRRLTLVLASVLALALTLTAAVATVPYVALGPGPTYDTLGEVDGEAVLQIEGRPTFPTDGQLDLTTVGVQPSLTLTEALQGWFERDLAVVPREVVFPPGRTDEEVDQENAAAMTASQGSAVRAAARQLGLQVAEVTVAEVPDADAPAAGLLQVGDVLTSVDGTEVRDAAELRELITAREPGRPVTIGYVRDGQAGEVVVPTRAAEGEDGQTRAVIGVTTAEEPVEVPFDVEITLQDVGGPSAGLMFSLGILDKLDPESLTGGQHIAGTGEITADGTVRPIGGISQKLIAADREGAVAFLVPEANCEEALTDPPEDLVLVEVGSLQDALDGLTALRDGETPITCAA